MGRQVGVDPLTVKNWEKNHTQPRLHLLPRIIEFLSYIPYTPIHSFPEQFAAYRRSLGLSRGRLAKLLGLDESTLARWEKKKGKPGRSLTTVKRFIDGGLPKI